MRKRQFATLCMLAIAMTIVSAALRAPAQTQIVRDPPTDAVIRRTDAGNNDPINPLVQRLPDIVEMRLGWIMQSNYDDDVFRGTGRATAEYMKFELVLDGLINPPGPIAYGQNPIYNPILYGPSPLYGFIEFDIDSDENTGGEFDYPYSRYLGNVARFSGLPHVPQLINRAAEDYSDLDGDIATPPFVDRSGEEFHLTFLAEDIESIEIIAEATGGNPALFEAGEVWNIHAHWFHRAHGWEPFLFLCWEQNGEYEPEVTVRFAHSIVTNQTTVTLIYPLTNNGQSFDDAICTRGTIYDGCPDNQNSILEALSELQFCAANPIDPWDPNFVMLANWATKNPNSFLFPETWRMMALVGTAFQAEPTIGGHYVWTDVWPNPRHGDFNGDCQIDAVDTAKLWGYIQQHDGQFDFDDDGSSTNNSILLHYFAQGCCMYDTDYDGIVSMQDSIVPGDMNLNGALDIYDLPDFVQALLYPAAYAPTHNGQDPTWRGDLNCDDTLDGLDIQLFVKQLTGQ